MKLTNHIRDAFVRSAMNDVPKVDHDAKICKLLLADSIAQLPPKLRPFAKDVDTEHCLRTATTWPAEGVCTCTVYEPRGTNFEPSAYCKPKLDELVQAAIAQNEQHQQLRDKLRAVAYSVTTRKALVEALPEFEKYLPADDQAALRTVPAIANVVASFVQAGWPNGKQSARAAA